MRRVVELKPDDAQALNALGYTLVDRTSRVAEGFALIERAHKLSPDDPFILDSMGWALFKLGRYAEAETLPAARDEGASRTPRSPRIWAKSCGRRASAIARRKSGSRSSRSRPTTRCCSKPCAASRGERVAQRRVALAFVRRRALVAAVAACATAPASLAPHRRWTLDWSRRSSAPGRLSARRGERWRRRALRRGGTARPRDAFDVATPLGQTVARMRRDASGVRVERPNEAPSSTATGARSRRRCSASPIPVDGLASWIQARSRSRLAPPTSSATRPAGRSCCASRAGRSCTPTQTTRRRGRRAS